jgi:hypothetical protein
MQQPLEPKLRIGTLCERVLEEKDGVLSLIRIIDRLIITAEGTEVPKELPPGQAAITAVMSWINGLGNYEARIRIQMPDNTSIESQTIPFYLDSLDKVQNLIIQMLLPVKVQGVYWFEFMLGEDIKNRLPLRVIYQRKQHPKPLGGSRPPAGAT